MNHPACTKSPPVPLPPPGVTTMGYTTDFEGPRRGVPGAFRMSALGGTLGS